MLQENQSLGVKAMGILGDVADRYQVDHMVSQALSEFGRIDILKQRGHSAS